MLTKRLPKTRKRVNEATNQKINAAIRERTIEKLHLYKRSNKTLISKRISRLEKEWDTERVLESFAGTLILISSCLGLKPGIKYKKLWFLVTGFIGFFILNHAIKGWCPPLPCIRKRMVRTPEEINKERTALKIIRGDFDEKSKNVIEILKKVES